jgi:hypothetical protein
MNSKHLLKIASDLQSIASELTLLTDGASANHKKTANRVPKKGDYVTKITTTFRDPGQWEDYEQNNYMVDRVEGKTVYVVSESGKPEKFRIEDLGPGKKWRTYDPKYDAQKIEKTYASLEATAKSLKPALTKMMKLSAKALGLPSSDVSEKWESRSYTEFGENYEQRYMVWKGEIRVKRSTIITLKIVLSTTFSGVEAHSEASTNPYDSEINGPINRVWGGFYLDNILEFIPKFPARLAEINDRFGLT